MCTELFMFNGSENCCMSPLSLNRIVAVKIKSNFSLCVQV